MKVAILSTFYPFRGGIAQFNANLLNELAKTNEVRAYTFTCQYPSFLFPGKTQYVTEEDNAVKVDALPVLNTANPFSYCRAAKIIAKWHPDVVFFRYWMSYFAPSQGMVARILRKKGIKVVTLVDNAFPHESKFFDKPFARWFFKANDALIGMSQAVLNDVATLHVTNKKRKSIPTKLMHHPLYNQFSAKVDRVEAKRHFGLDPEKKTLLFFGFIRDYKGLDLLIEAMDHLDESYQLLIAGECYGSFEKYEQLIAGRKHPENIICQNRYISDDEVTEFFSAADVCILPYRSATQSGIIAICYNFELPVIATNVGGLAESIVSPNVGLMTEQISAEAIARSVIKYFAMDRTVFIANIKKLKEELTWPNFAAQLIDFINELQV